MSKQLHEWNEALFLDACETVKDRKLSDKQRKVVKLLLQNTRRIAAGFIDAVHVPGEKEHYLGLISETEGNVKQMAKRLHMSIPAVYSKLHQYGLKQIQRRALMREAI